MRFFIFTLFSIILSTGYSQASAIPMANCSAKVKILEQNSNVIKVKVLSEDTNSSCQAKPGDIYNINLTYTNHNLTNIFNAKYALGSSNGPMGVVEWLIWYSETDNFQQPLGTSSVN